MSGREPNAEDVLISLVQAQPLQHPVNYLFSCREPARWKRHLMILSFFHCVHTQSDSYKMLHVREREWREFNKIVLKGANETQAHVHVLEHLRSYVPAG